MTVRLTATWNSSPMMVAISGVATLKVVAVPASKVFLASSLSHMQHKAECHRQHQIEAPRDKAPMEQGIHPRPVLNAAHFG